MISRIIPFDWQSEGTCFLWGPRQTGKTTLLKMLFPSSRRYDLLLADEYRRLTTDPTLLRQECEAAGLTGSTQTSPVVIDEIQKIPDLLDEVHWLIENRGLKFILCGSSARKLKRQQGSLLGGRAVRKDLHPFVSAELTDFDLDRALNHGLLPRHYLHEAPEGMLDAYVGDYLREEIAAEALTRNIPAFSRFLEIAATSNGEMVNYANIARECGVSAPTVRQYFEILSDTRIGRFVEVYRKRAKRRVITAPKFYFFDTGLVAQLTRRGRVSPGSELYGRALEQFILMELIAHSDYSRIRYPISYWRTASGLEVDFILGDAETAVEVKSTQQAVSHHWRNLKALREEHAPRRTILVTLDPRPRVPEPGIEVLPLREFLARLWGNELVRG